MQKSKYIKHTHISEGKFREILRLFCADLTSTQIAEVAKVKRNTINRILQLLRKQNHALRPEKSRWMNLILEPNKFEVKEGAEQAAR